MKNDDTRPILVYPTEAKKISTQLADKLKRLNELTSEITSDLAKVTGKYAKGDQIVGLLGETIVKALFGGTVVKNEGTEVDVIVGAARISVKTRRGNHAGWTQTGIISSKNPNAVDFLAFVHLNDSYQLDGVWLFPWKDILNRIHPKKVHGIPRGYTFHLSPEKDSKHYKRFP